MTSCRGPGSAAWNLGRALGEAFAFLLFRLRDAFVLVCAYLIVVATATLYMWAMPDTAVAMQAPTLLAAAFLVVWQLTAIGQSKTGWTLGPVVIAVFLFALAVEVDYIRDMYMLAPPPPMPAMMK